MKTYSTTTAVTTLFTITLFLVFVTILSFVLILFKTRDNIAQATLLETEIYQTKKEEMHKETLSNLLDKHSPDLEYFENLFLKESDVVEFLQDIEEVGSYANIFMKIGSIQDSDNKIYITISATGSYDGVRKLIELMESIPTASVAEFVSVSRQRKTSMWNASIKMSVFKQ